MARSGKRVGGVRGVNTKAPRAIPIERGDAWEPPKKLGGVTTPKIRHCFNCEGEFRHGHWIHSTGCDQAPCIWKADGKGKEDWACRYQCIPIETPSTFTHDTHCIFWDEIAQAGDDIPF